MCNMTSSAKGPFDLEFRCETGYWIQNTDPQNQYFCNANKNENYNMFFKFSVFS